MSGDFYKKPVGSEYSISSEYGLRTDPISGKESMHGGVDFITPIGTKIGSVADGSVIRSGQHRQYGEFIVIRHDNGESTLYAHLRDRYVVANHFTTDRLNLSSLKDQDNQSPYIVQVSYYNEHRID